MAAATLPLLAFTLLLRRNAPVAGTRRFEPDFQKIRCPLCRWEPQKTDRWVCDPGCHHRWNTFDTAGICPSCGKHWDETACLRCGGWSPHADWYEEA